MMKEKTGKLTMSFGYLEKLMKWAHSGMRTLCLKIRLGSKLEIEKGKPPYIGRGVRVSVGKGGRCTFCPGVYLSDACVVEVMDGATLKFGRDVYMNEACRIVSAESIEIKQDVLCGPNVQIYDHDHVFDSEGVHEELMSSPVIIGEKSWLAANVVVTRGEHVPAKSLIAANSVVSSISGRPGGLYAGVPAKLIKRYDHRNVGEMKSN